MGLDGIVEIHKAAQFLLPMFRAVKLLLFMPHLHNRPYYPFGFAVSLRTGRTGNCRNQQRCLHVIRLLEAVVGTVLRHEQPAARGFEYTVDGGAADHVTARKGSNALFSLCVGRPDGLAVMRGKAGVFVHVDDSIVLGIL